MLIVALTGNYGMGKTTALEMFRDLGAATLKTDEVVDTLLKDAGVLKTIKREFGDGVFSGDGDLNREKLSSIVFRDSGMRGRLEKILHPLVFERIEEFLKGLVNKVAGKGVVIIEIPLLFEKGYTERFSKNIVVYADEEAALKRLEELGITRDNAMMRLNAQMPIKEKVKRADFVIDNSGSLEHTRAQVIETYHKLLED
ncbi:MAG TPA: dephospho-CoA kinase [Thermodesulfovibrionales bacterium]|nr:dephospho-CoA kinase [Thermodesulfovibrionales bacterium]